MGQRLRVLDVGMGQGTQALRLARAGHKVTGVEQDPAMVAAARAALADEPEGIRAGCASSRATAARPACISCRAASTSCCATAC